MELTFGSRDLNDQTSINPNEIAKGMVLEERTGDDDEDGYGGGKDNGASPKSHKHHISVFVRQYGIMFVIIVIIIIIIIIIIYRKVKVSTLKHV